ncbi:MAG: GntR family transcriptional regulator [Gammaproteobacteria bacterium]|nr:GntR family transcriptional regulator [Gammaproteobacteria bacterium]
MTSQASSVIPRRTLQREIASRLREEIVEGIWPPGERLQERVLCERYGVSRSPLREAFQVMAGEGLLELHPNRGAVVTRPTMTDFLENMEIVMALASLAIRLACDCATDAQLVEIEELHARMHDHSERGEIVPYFELNNEVHMAVVKAGGNSALVSMYEHADRHITRLQNLSGALEADPELSMGEHDRFISALLKRDADAAGAAIEAHLSSVARIIKQRITESVL